MNSTAATEEPMPLSNPSWTLGQHCAISCGSAEGSDPDVRKGVTVQILESRSGNSSVIAGVRMELAEAMSRLHSCQPTAATGTSFRSDHCRSSALETVTGISRSGLSPGHQNRTPACSAVLLMHRGACCVLATTDASFTRRCSTRNRGESTNSRETFTREELPAAAQRGICVCR